MPFRSRDMRYLEESGYPDNDIHNAVRFDFPIRTRYGYFNILTEHVNIDMFNFMAVCVGSGIYVHDTLRGKTKYVMHLYITLDAVIVYLIYEAMNESGASHYKFINKFYHTDLTADVKWADLVGQSRAL